MLKTIDSDIDISSIHVRSIKLLGLDLFYEIKSVLELPNERVQWMSIKRETFNEVWDYVAEMPGSV